MEHRAMAGIRAAAMMREKPSTYYMSRGIDRRAVVGDNLNAFALKNLLVL